MTPKEKQLLNLKIGLVAGLTVLFYSWKINLCQWSVLQKHVAELKTLYQQRKAEIEGMPDYLPEPCNPE